MDGTGGGAPPSSGAADPAAAAAAAIAAAAVAALANLSNAPQPPLPNVQPAAAAYLNNAANGQQPAAGDQQQPVIAGNGMVVSDVIMKARILQADPATAIPEDSFNVLIRGLNQIQQGQEIMDAVLTMVQEESPDHMANCVRMLQQILAEPPRNNIEPDPRQNLLNKLQADAARFRGQQQQDQPEPAAGGSMEERPQSRQQQPLNEVQQVHQPPQQQPIEAQAAAATHLHQDLYAQNRIIMHQLANQAVEQQLQQQRVPVIQHPIPIAPVPVSVVQPPQVSRAQQEQANAMMRQLQANARINQNEIIQKLQQAQTAIQQAQAGVAAGIPGAAEALHRAQMTHAQLTVQSNANNAIIAGPAEVHQRPHMLQPRPVQHMQQPVPIQRPMVVQPVPQPAPVVPNGPSSNPQLTGINPADLQNLLLQLAEAQQRNQPPQQNQALITAAQQLLQQANIPAPIPQQLQPPPMQPPPMPQPPLGGINLAQLQQMQQFQQMMMVNAQAEAQARAQAEVQARAQAEAAQARAESQLRAERVKAEAKARAEREVQEREAQARAQAQRNAVAAANLAQLHQAQAQGLIPPGMLTGNQQLQLLGLSNSLAEHLENAQRQQQRVDTNRPPQHQIQQLQLQQLQLAAMQHMQEQQQAQQARPQGPMNAEQQVMAQHLRNARDLERQQQQMMKRMHEEHVARMRNGGGLLMPAPNAPEALLQQLNMQRTLAAMQPQPPAAQQVPPSVAGLPRPQPLMPGQQVVQRLVPSSSSFNPNQVIGIANQPHASNIASSSGPAASVPSSSGRSTATPVERPVPTITQIQNASMIPFLLPQTLATPITGVRAPSVSAAPSSSSTPSTSGTSTFAAPAAPVASAASTSSTPLALPGTITQEMMDEHRRAAPSHHGRFFSHLLRLCECAPDALYVRKRAPDSFGNDNKAGEQYAEFSGRCIKPSSPYVEPSALDRRQMDELHMRCNALYNFCLAIFPQLSVRMILHHDPAGWGYRIPNEISPDMVRMVAATAEYKKKLCDVKLLHDWFDLFKKTKAPSDMYASFRSHFANRAISNEEAQVDNSSKMIEKAIENVSLEWAEARMRLCEFLSQIIFQRGKMELIPACAKALLDEVDRLSSIDPVEPNVPSIAHGNFAHNGLPLWIPFGEGERDQLVIPASGYMLRKPPAPSSSTASPAVMELEEGEIPFKRRRPNQPRTLLGSPSDQPSTSGVPNPFLSPQNLQFHLPPSQLQALSQIHAAAEAEKAQRSAAAAAAARTVANPLAAELLMQLHGATNGAATIQAPQLQQQQPRLSPMQQPQQLLRSPQPPQQQLLLQQQQPVIQSPQSHPTPRPSIQQQQGPSPQPQQQLEPSLLRLLPQHQQLPLAIQQSTAKTETPQHSQQSNGVSKKDDIPKEEPDPGPKQDSPKKEEFKVPAIPGPSTSCIASTSSSNHPFRLPPTPGTKVVKTVRFQVQETIPEPATLHSDPSQTIRWMENGRELVLSPEETLEKVRKNSAKKNEEWEILDQILKNYLENHEETRLMEEVPKPSKVSREVIWNRMMYERAVYTTKFIKISKLYMGTLFRAKNNLASTQSVTQETVSSTRGVVEDTALIQIEALSNSNRLCIAILDKMFSKEASRDKSIGTVCAEMDDRDRNTLMQQWNLRELRQPISIDSGYSSDFMKKWREHEELSARGVYPVDATELSKRFHEAPGEIRGKCHVLVQIVEAMLKYPRFENLAFPRRTYITLAMLYIHGHVKAEPGKYSIDDLVKIDITCNVLQSLFGHFANDPEEFQRSMATIIAAIKRDKEIQELMRRIMVDDVHVDKELIAARREYLANNPEGSSFVRNTPPSDGSTEEKKGDEPKENSATTPTEPNPPPEPSEVNSTHPTPASPTALQAEAPANT